MFSLFQAHQSHFSAFLFLADSAAILEAPGTQGFVEGDHAELVCKAMGAPLPTIVWKKSSTVLENSDRIQISVNQSTESLLVTSRLVISSVSTYDAGQYYCCATNTLSQGETSSDEVFFSLVIQSETTRSLRLFAFCNTCMLLVQRNGLTILPAR